MARSLNKVLLIGRLGQDPDLKHTASGAALINLTVATNRTRANADGTLVSVSLFL